MKELERSVLADLLISKGVNTFEDATTYIANLPYGRNSNRLDFSLVIKEAKGTCSSKHAFLKCLISEQDILGWELILGMFKMNGQNTPAISEILDVNGLEYIPEAHTYLKHKDVRYDYTTTSASFANIKNDIIDEVVIEPDQVIKWKIAYHKNFIKSWLENNSMHQSFEEIWKIREICIVKLSK